MTILDMIDATQYAYKNAYESELFTEGGSDMIIEAVHDACNIDCDNKCEFINYLQLSPAKLQKLYFTVREVVLIELTEAEIINNKMLDSLCELFNIKCEVKVEFK